MKDFRKGVSYYTTGSMQLDIHFPEDDVCCFHCQRIYKDSVGRYMCDILRKELYSVSDSIHPECPLIFKEE